MTSRRALPTYPQRVSRALQFIPGHVGGRVDSAQPVESRSGTVSRGGDGLIRAAAGGGVISSTAWAKDYADSVGLVDLGGTLSSTGTVDYTRDVTDTVALTDTVNVGIPRDLALADTMSPTDSVTTGPATESAYTTQTPTPTSITTNALGSDIRYAVSGQVTGMRYWRVANATGASRTLRLWSSSGALLGTCTTSGDTGTGWRYATFSSPIPVWAGQTTRAVMEHASGNLAVTTVGSNIVNGNLTLLSANGYNGTTGTYPTGSLGTSHFMVDVVFQAVTVAQGGDARDPLGLTDTVFISARSYSDNAGLRDTVSTSARFYSDNMPLRDTVSTDARSYSETYTLRDAALAGIPGTYGPTAYSYDVGDTPGTTDATERGAGGNDVTFSVAGQIIGMRYWWQSGHTDTTKTCRVWAMGGVLLGTVTIPTAASGWSSDVMFTTPIPVVGGQTIRAVVELPNTDIVARTASNGGVGVQRGDMFRGPTFYASGSAGTFPITAFTTRWYMTDILFQRGPY